MTGLTTSSPQAPRVLTGKCRAGVPEGGRAAQRAGFARRGLTDERRNEAVQEPPSIALRSGASATQQALAWFARTPCESIVMLGASGLDQLTENLGAPDALAKLDAKTLERIDAISRPLAA